MKILYTISTPYGLGADRWVYEGYKNAFLDEGHEFYTLTENDDFQNTVLRVKPDILMLDFGFFEKLFFLEGRKIQEGFFERIKNSGIKIFALVHLPGSDLEDKNNEATKERVDFYKKYLPLFDICYNHNAPWAIERLESSFGRKFHFIPVAADSRMFFPDPDPVRVPSRTFVPQKLSSDSPLARTPSGLPRQNYQRHQTDSNGASNKYSQCDIAFVGSAFTQKKDRYQEWLFPLFKKYRVCLYGPGWTRKDRALRAAGHISRKIRAGWLTKFIGSRRVTISADDERKLYASAKICINLHETYKDKSSRGFTNDREFKVPASGGFQISDYIPHLKMFFEPDKEIVLAKTPAEWFSKIEYYLRNEKERKEIQQRGTERVLREHTYRHRVRHMVSLYDNL